MRTRTRYGYFFAALMLAIAARAEQWFTVASPWADATGTHVEVDLESVQARGPDGQAVIRVSYDGARPHGAGFHYRSFVASARFDCQRRTISLTSAAYYAQAAGAGPRVGADSSSRQGGMPGNLLDSVPAAARRALLRATCATTRTSAV